MEYHIEKLGPHHQLKGFRSANNKIDWWLKKFALVNQVGDLAVTYVLINSEGKVVGFVTLSMFRIDQEHIDQALTPENGFTGHIPALLIGRLAIHKNHERKKLGTRLLAFAFDKAVELADSVGCGFVVAEAKEEAVSWYEKLNWYRSPINKSYFYMPLVAIRANPATNSPSIGDQEKVVP